MTHPLLKPLAAVAVAALLSTTALAEVVYNRGNDTDPETLDQHKTSTVAEAHILRDLYEGLVVYDAKAEIIPGMAESWKISDDGLTYTFSLREGAKWSNGDPVTAEDFAFSLRRIMSPETAAKYANVLFPIKNAEKVSKGEAKPEELGVKAVDERTLEITLENPTAYFLELLTHQTGLPVHKASVEKLGADFVKPGNMVSNGAYTLKEFTPNDKIVLVKNPNFHDAANVKIDQVIYIPFEDQTACLRRFEAGEIHSCSDIPADQMEYIKSKLEGKYRIAPYLGTYYFAVKTDKEKLSDPRLRRALSLAVDREFLAEEIWQGTMLPAYSFVPPGIANYDEPAYADYKDKDQLDREDEAKKLLEEAGIKPESLQLEIIYNTTVNNKNTVTAVADMWKKALGIESTQTNMDGSTYFGYLRDKGDFDIARAGWIGDYSDPQNFLFLVESDNTGFNYANYKNPEYDALLDEAAETTDLQKRAGILKKAEEIFMRDLPYIPLLYYSSKALVSEKLQGWEDNIMNVHGSRFLSLAQ